jgi:ribonuclease P protein subunit POP4
MNNPNTRDILRQELIGLEARVVKSTNPSLLKIKGKVIDETLNTLTILSSGEKKTVAKDTATFCLRLQSGERLEVEGKQLIKRPEDRVKMKTKRIW